MRILGDGKAYTESITFIIEPRPDVAESSIDNIPNIITPNGDNLNDYYFVETTELESFFIRISCK